MTDNCSNDDADWRQEAASAQQTIDSLIARFPEELRKEALSIGYEIHKYSSDRDGDHTLGGYWRSAQLIRLYLRAIEDKCGEESLDLRKEIEITYLHEFGHHLGLDEKAVEEFGL
jgi:predicted Zn-dependent protease with MMP-like domain